MRIFTDNNLQSFANRAINVSKETGKLLNLVIFTLSQLASQSIMPGKLTTHVLDTMKGRPAASVIIELWRINPETKEKIFLKTVKTNTDGRTDEPLLINDEFEVGVYELVFGIGAYFNRTLDNVPSPSFLDQVPIQFGIADAMAHYHVPLLASPWSYSTYRGS